jgi:hypothetical protein
MQCTSAKMPKTYSSTQEKSTERSPTGVQSKSSLSTLPLVSFFVRVFVAYRDLTRSLAQIASLPTPGACTVTLRTRR